MQSKKTSSGFEIPSLGLGTWEMGGRDGSNNSADDKEIEAICFALEIGYSHIDTAEIYGMGHTEELVGKALEGKVRKNVFITSKVRSANLAYDNVLRAVEGSLKRLKTDYLDLYLIHAPNPAIPLKETMRAMNRLIDEKLILWQGVSNFDTAQLQEVQAYSNSKIVANQVEYNLFTRNLGVRNQNMESEIYPYCLENDIIFVAWRPLGKGIVSLKSLPVIDELSIKYGKSPAQIAIQWLISKENVATIPKASSKEHLIENFGALGWNLSQKDVIKLDEIEI